MQQDPLRPGDDDDRQSDSLNDSAAEDPSSASVGGLSPRLAEFERLYRAEFGTVAAYFARRVADPQLVADLTADTFVAAIRSFDEYETGKRSSRAWAIAVARRVHGRYLESDPRDAATRGRSPAHRLLDRAETKELTWWIDVEQSSRELMERLSAMSALDREAVELVDLCGLSTAEAAHELGVSSGALRVRLVRTRARLKREGGARG
jgi:RNA polymerase sigma-70 factor (ECF subfamily)